LIQEALQIHHKLPSDNHSDLALTYNSLGSLYAIMMASELAFKYFLKSCAIHLASGNPDEFDLWITRTTIRQLQASSYSVSSTSS
ncbi:unnamed protein product, partial [Rotaria sp. Silwood1]